MKTIEIAESYSAGYDNTATVSGNGDAGIEAEFKRVFLQTQQRV